HADVGGATPGSMGIAQDLHGEGLVIPPVLLRRRGEPQAAVLALFAANVRGAAERQLDLAAQEASLLLLAERLQGLVAGFGASTLRVYVDHLFDCTERCGRDAVRALRRGTFAAEDALEDDGQGSGPLPLRLLLHNDGRSLRFDWRRSGAQGRG